MNRAFFATSALSVLGLVGCASGGGSPTGTAVAYKVNAAAQPTTGSNPPTTPAAGYQQAARGGPNLVLAGAAAPVAGTVFALLQTALSVSSTSISADATANADGATATIVNAGADQIELKIPSLSVDSNVTINAASSVALPNGDTLAVTQLTKGVQDLLGGRWTVGGQNTGPPVEVGNFIIGYQTATANVPTTGVATYSETGAVSGLVYAPAQAGFTTPYGSGAITGDASLTADFGAGKITGSLSNLQVRNLSTNSSSAWNTIAISGAISGASFTGSTSTSSGPTGPFALLGTATGTIAGGFYGPNVDEVGAVWTIADGNNAATGVLGAPLAGFTPYAVVAAAAPTVGVTPPTTAAAGLELAVAGGPNLNLSGASAPAAGTVFAATQTALQISGVGISPDAAANAAGATITIVNAASGQVQLAIPSLGISSDVTINSATDLKLPNGDYLALTQLTQGVDDLLGGRWSVKDTHDANPIGVANFIIGYQTPTAGVPTTGAATYSAAGAVSGQVYAPGVSGFTTPYGVGTITGAATLTADFDQGVITGAISNTQVKNAATNTLAPWNSIAITGTISGAAFSGATSTTAGPTGPFALQAAATGTIAGGFYGATGQEIGAVWTIADGTNSASGVLGAPLTAFSPYTVLAAATPTVGANPPTTAAEGLELASSGGPNLVLSGPSAPAAGTVFAETQSALVIGPASISPDAATNAAGATVTVVNAAAGQVELKLPGLGIDTDVTINNATDVKLPDGQFLRLVQLTQGVSDLIGGRWVIRDTNDVNQTNAGYFVFGYQTPVSGMPTTGSATYSGAGAVSGSVYTPGVAGFTTPYGVGLLTGDATFSANFYSGSLTGTLSNINVKNPNNNSVSPWNTITVTGAIAGDAFSGATATTAGPAGLFALGAGAGAITGGFYGPNANELGATWTISDGTSSALGVVGVAASAITPITILAPAPATVGANPPTTAAGGLEFAASGGPDFTGTTSLPTVGTVFAATQSALALNATTIVADTATNSQGATQTVVNAGAGQYELKVPGVSLDAIVTIAGAPSNAPPLPSAFTRLANGDYLDVVNLTPGGVNYLLADQWILNDSSNASTLGTGWLLTGYQTPTANLPSGGTATYSAVGSVYGSVYANQGSTYQAATLYGDASLTADFSSGAITGSLSNIKASTSATTRYQWNSVSIVGALSGSTFSGTTSTTGIGAAASGGFGLGASGVGSINGGFYGPAANEIGAVWTLSDGASSAVGVLGAPLASTAVAIDAFDQPTVGATPPTTAAAGYELAAVGGPAIAAAPAGTVFALTQTAVQFSPVTIGPDTATNSAGATLTQGTANTFLLSVPSLGVTDVSLSTGNVQAQASNGQWASLNQVYQGGQEASGYWSVANTLGGAPTETAWYVIGYQTPLTAMPTAGSATFSETGGVNGQVYAAGAPGFSGGYGVGVLKGDVTLTANFFTDRITGLLSNINVTDPANSSVAAWNSIAVNGAISGNTFAGGTSNQAGGAGPFALGVGSGTITGGFYGPGVAGGSYYAGGNEVGAVWTDSDGVKSAVGSIGAPLVSSTPATILPFAPASEGATPPKKPGQGLQLATTNTTFGTGKAGTIFALSQSVVSLQTTSGGVAITADAPVNAATATMTQVSANLSSFVLKIPTLQLSVALTPNAAPVQAPSGQWVSLSQTYPGSFEALGEWSVSSTQAGPPTAVGSYVVGYITPGYAMPTSGTATYTGTASGQVYVPVTNGGASLYTVNSLTGDVTLTADFAAGAVNGSISNTQVTGTGAATNPAWNTVTLTGSIVAKNSFVGQTSAASSPTGAASAPYVLGANATGSLSGHFYGPTAQEIGAIWTLSAGGRSAVGQLGGNSTVPSDRRLKRDIRPLARTEGGVQLYRYRYLGDRRLFVGVMAQDLLADPRFAGAVIRRADGLYMVDYGRIGVRVKNLAGMRAAGEGAIRRFDAAAGGAT